MEKFNLPYSLKNIPCPDKTAFEKSLIDKVEHFLKRMRWKAFFFDNEDQSEVSKDTFGFKTRNTPPQNAELVGFENDMYNLISNLTYRKDNSQFQKKLQNDMAKLKNSPDIIVEADKTNNIYLVKPSNYKKLVQENVTQSYKICEENEKEKIDEKSAKIALSLELEERIQQFNERNCFITLKDHKPNFQNNPKCRLLNPAKSELGKVSQQLLKDIISQLTAESNFNLWKNTDSVVEWFKASYKNKAKFIKFDIVDFYPSISKELLNKAIKFAKTYVNISDQNLGIIIHSKSSLLFSNGKTWIKKNGLFDVTMGSFDGAETCELVALYLLHKLSTVIPPSQLGLYRDDGLGIIPNANGPKMEKLRKDIIKIFKKEGLKITCESNLTETDFLDVTFNIESTKYTPYRKPNDNPQYINTSSNHPPQVIKHIPATISQRLSRISCDETEFSKVHEAYQKALTDSGHTEKLKFEQPLESTLTRPNRRRRRKIIWFNPPFNKNLETNLGHKFLKLLVKHFPKSHKYHKLFNKNSVKLSYSCTPNVSMLLKKFNRQKIEKIEVPAGPTISSPSKCSCRNKQICPLNGNCLERSLVYEAELITPQDKFHYVGLTEGTFKDRMYKHNTSFNHNRYINSTELSKKIWELKEKHINYDVNWKIVKKASAYSGGKTCDLCLTEKHVILTSKSKNLLNTRNELISKCRHMNKFMLRKKLKDS